MIIADAISKPVNHHFASEHKRYRLGASPSLHCLALCVSVSDSPHCLALSEESEDVVGLKERQGTDLIWKHVVV